MPTHIWLVKDEELIAQVPICHKNCVVARSLLVTRSIYLVCDTIISQFSHWRPVMVVLPIMELLVFCSDDLFGPLFTNFRSLFHYL